MERADRNPIPPDERRPGAAEVVRPLVPPGEDRFWDAGRVNRWTWYFVGLGALALSLRYLLRFPLYLDEAFLSVNHVGRGPLDLMRPLEYYQVCPLWFLWVQWAVVALLGFSEYALRLVPLVCGLASLLAFRSLARMVFKGTALLLAVGAFSVAYPLVRYASQAKPYSCDLLAATVLLAMAVKWRSDPRTQRWLWALAASLPILLGLSYAPVFVAGAISLSAAAVLWRLRCRRGWLAWTAYNLSLAASLCGLFVLSAGGQRAATRECMEWYWNLQDAFPPLRDIGRLPGWLLRQHAGDMAAYPIGGAHYASTPTFVCTLFGLAALLRRRQFFVVSSCLTPLLANFVAACLKLYPYGGHVRVMLYAAPLLCLPAGLGAALFLSRLRTRPGQAHVPVLVVSGLLAMVAVGSAVRDLVRPYKMEISRETRDFARWFWASKAHDADLVCLESDLHLDFSGGPIEGKKWSNLFDTSALYRCNREIYRPKANPPDPDPKQGSAQRPVRYVYFRSWAFSHDDAALGRWLQGRQSQYRLAGRETHRFPISWLDRRDRCDAVEVYEFVAK